MREDGQAGQERDAFRAPGGWPIAPKSSGSRGPFIPPTDGSSTIDAESIASAGKVLQADPKGPGSGGDAVGNDAARPFKGLK